MKELVVFINDIRDLSVIEKPFEYQNVYSHELGKCLKKIHETLIGSLTDLEVNRFYFGTEFCQFLLPSVEDIEKVCKFSYDKKLEFSFVTPFITDSYIDKLVDLLDVVNHYNRNNEIIFNDWGVFYLIKDCYKDFHCIPGRLIDKTLRDPRYSAYEYENSFSKAGLRFLQRPNITSCSYKCYLRTNNLSRVELDVLPQGFDFSDSEIAPFKLSVYLPFGHLTTGRQCMMRMLNREPDRKFILDDSCTKNCLKYGQMMHKRQGALLAASEGFKRDVDLLRKGNSVFYYFTEIDDIKKLDCIDRIVYQPLFSI